MSSLWLAGWLADWFDGKCSYTTPTDAPSYLFFRMEPFYRIVETSPSIRVCRLAFSNFPVLHRTNDVVDRRHFHANRIGCIARARFISAHIIESIYFFSAFSLFVVMYFWATRFAVKRERESQVENEIILVCLKKQYRRIDTRQRLPVWRLTWPKFESLCVLCVSEWVSHNSVIVFFFQKTRRRVNFSFSRCFDSMRFAKTWTFPSKTSCVCVRWCCNFSLKLNRNEQINVTLLMQPLADCVGMK